jgi:hypothetical protein
MPTSHPKSEAAAQTVNFPILKAKDPGTITLENI